MASGPSRQNIDPQIFQNLQDKIDEEIKIKEELRDITQTLEKQGRLTQSILSRAQNTPSVDLGTSVLQPAKTSINEQIQTIQRLSTTATKYPFYQWNNLWTRDVQNLVGPNRLFSL